jgi:hypothetical protein
VQQDYVDVSVATDVPQMVSVPTQTDVSMASVLPPYSPTPAPRADDILAAAHPIHSSSLEESALDEMDVEADYANMSLALGKRCVFLEQELAKKQSQTLRRCGHPYFVRLCCERCRS